MRIFTNIVLVATLILLVGCACRHKWPILPNGESIATLNATANATSRDQADRASAIFSLFAHHLKPGCSAADVHLVLTDTRWLQVSDLSVVGDISGWIPVDLSDDRTVFELYLISRESIKTASSWSICFSLSGPNRSVAEALAFLNGSPTLSGSPKLLEFALIFPAPKEPHGWPGMRVERYSEHGIQVYPE